MQDNITGKTILLLGDKFHSYCDKMKETLIDLGAKEVILIEMKNIMSFTTEN